MSKVELRPMVARAKSELAQFAAQVEQAAAPAIAQGKAELTKVAGQLEDAVEQAKKAVAAGSAAADESLKGSERRDRLFDTHPTAHAPAIEAGRRAGELAQAGVDFFSAATKAAKR